MTISVGQDFPQAKFKRKGAEGLDEIDTAAIFAKGRKVVLFGLPGAFTPTCSARHLPGFVDQIAAIKAKGVAEVVCLSVNDAFVMDAWAKAHGAEGKVSMIPDGNGDITRKLGLELDASGFGMGLRCQRFAMIVNDGKVSQIFLEKPGAFETSSAENVLKSL